jgi:hypothetical protein
MRRKGLEEGMARVGTKPVCRLISGTASVWVLLFFELKMRQRTKRARSLVGGQGLAGWDVYSLQAMVLSGEGSINKALRTRQGGMWYISRRTTGYLEF